jgi:putative ATP-binding cassette transporter
MKRILKIVLPVMGRGGLLKYIILGILSGLCGFAFLNLVTLVISVVMEGRLTSVSKEYIIIFALVILFFIWIRKTLSTAVIHLSQTLFWNFRKQVLELVLKANYQQLTSKRTKVYAVMVNDINVLTSASLSILEFVTATIVAISCLIFLASISFVLFSITAATALLGIGIYQVGSKKNVRDLQDARKLEDTFVEHFNSILNGFKEIFMEPRKGKIINEQVIIPIANEAYAKNKTAFTGFLTNQIIGQVLFYLLISSVLLFLSVVLKIKSSDTVSFVFTLLYLLSTIETIMVTLPNIMRASVASEQLTNLKKELEEANFNNPLPSTYIAKNAFEKLVVKDLTFHYGAEEQSFSIGPISFEVEKGEVVFIYGGNGSGKTTFVNTVLGLCQPASGEIKWNDTRVNADNYSEYRTLFSAVFSDFYLFNELYGIEDVDLEKWDFYLKLFEINEKVKLDGKRFSTTNLSTGQRKRLALIANLMEEKPILVIDEWAADQDPYFRKKFYTVIIPLLKNEGATIIAITHDDKYYKCADKLYKMEEGRLIPENLLAFQDALEKELAL